MKHRISFVVALSLLCYGHRALGQRDYSKVTVKATHLAGAVHMLEGSGGHIGVSAGPDGILIVDDQYEPLAEKIRAALSEINPGKLRFILNTHWHGDHTGGNVFFGREAPIIAHANVLKRLSTRQELFGRVVEPLPPAGLPVVTFEEALSIHFNGEEIKVLHFPHGHTDGDSVVFFTGSNVVHMGDFMFAGMFPFVDLDHGGDVVGLSENIAKIIPMLRDDVKIIPGHGPLSTLGDLKDYHKMLVETTDFVRGGIKAGKSLDELIAAGVPDKWKSWGEGFIKTDKWIGTIHQSLTRK